MNWSDYIAIKELESTADRNGFKLVSSRTMLSGMYLNPKGTYKNLDATLPVYSRDAEFGMGTVEGNIAFLRGWERALDYMRALGILTDKNLQKKLVHFNELYKKQEELREQQKTLDLLKK